MTNPTDTASPPVEAALLQLIARRDVDAISELYDLQSTSLNTLIHRIVSDGVEAEETLQGVFLRVWGEAGSYNPESSHPLVWLTRIARDLAIERAHGREVDIDLRTDLTVEQTARQDNPATHSEKQREIAQAMMELPIEHRTLIEYAYFRGYTLSELANVFELPIGTVKARIRSGMSALRTRLQHSLETHTTMNSLYLEELAALNALGALDGEEARDFERLAANVTPEAQQEIAEYEKVAVLIAAACGQDVRPSAGVKERLMKRICDAGAAKII